MFRFPRAGSRTDGPVPLPATRGLAGRVFDLTPRRAGNAKAGSRRPLTNDGQAPADQRWPRPGSRPGSPTTAKPRLTPRGCSDPCSIASPAKKPLERKVEAAGGFEPPRRGFADLSLNHLGTPPFGRRGVWQRETLTQIASSRGGMRARCSGTPGRDRIHPCLTALDPGSSETVVMSRGSTQNNRNDDRADSRSSDGFLRDPSLSPATRRDAAGRRRGSCRGRTGRSGDSSPGTWPSRLHGNAGCRRRPR